MIFPGSYLSRNGALRRIVEDERPDLVEIADKYTLNYFGALIRAGAMNDRLPTTPVVVGLSCERMDDNFRVYVGANKLGERFCRFYLKWLYFTLFDHHISNSDYTAAELRSAADAHSVQRGVWVSPMGADFGILNPARRSLKGRQMIAQKFRTNLTARFLLYVGRIVPEKNLDLLLETLEVLTASGRHDWRLIIVGDGMERQKLQRAAETRIPGRALFLGHLTDRESLADLYANCDVFLHPNPREPFGIAPLEALASGLPLVAPNSGGVLAYANSENSWLTTADAKSFARAVQAVFEDRQERARKIANALKTAAALTWEKAAGRYLDLYREIWEHSRGGQRTTSAAFFSKATQSSNSRIGEMAGAIARRLVESR
jgi:glycosyltransferase involved in cell wall biosynthesis